MQRVDPFACALKTKIGQMTLRLGVDIGGTFTDFVVIDEGTGAITVDKCLTTPRHPEEAILTGIGRMEARDLGGASFSADIVHATTLVTNAIIEGKGAATGLVTTEGFRDLLEMGRESRYYVYDLEPQFPQPIIPRSLRRTVHERTFVDGTSIPLDEDELAGIVRDFQRQGVRAIAVMFLHSYRNPANELRARDVIRTVAPDMQVSLSHQVVSRPREYERLSTTVLDAYIKPIISGYIDRLQERLDERAYAKSLSMMLSNGGISPIDIAKDYPIQLVESGPAAGVEAARYYGNVLGLDRVLAFDMGGTTAKLCLVRDGKVGRTRDFEVARVHRYRKGSGYPIAVQVYDLLEIGAGGGSIAGIDGLGLLAVGPRSAGSEPGPACYGRGGTRPTVTDANVVLGFISPASFLGGEFVLDGEAAACAIDIHVAAPLGISIEAAAWGILDLVTETMASAARLHLAEHGQDPSRCALIATGGAGPVHAVALARRLEVPTVVVPPMPGVMSAFGLLVARRSFEISRAIRIPFSGVAIPEIERMFGEIEVETRARSGITGQMVIERYVEIRHVGQESAVEVEISGNWEGAATASAALDGFGDEYERRYGRRGDGGPLEISTLRVAVAAESGGEQKWSAIQPEHALPRSQRTIRFGEKSEAVAVIQRGALAAGDEVVGPAVIEERESTTVIWPGDRVVVDASSALIISVGLTT